MTGRKSVTKSYLSMLDKRPMRWISPVLNPNIPTFGFFGDGTTENRSRNLFFRVIWRQIKVRKLWSSNIIANYQQYECGYKLARKHNENSSELQWNGLEIQVLLSNVTLRVGTSSLRPAMIACLWLSALFPVLALIFIPAKISVTPRAWFIQSNGASRNASLTVHASFPYFYLGKKHH